MLFGAYRPGGQGDRTPQLNVNDGRNQVKLKNKYKLPVPLTQGPKKYGPDAGAPWLYGISISSVPSFDVPSRSLIGPTYDEYQSMLDEEKQSPMQDNLRSSPGSVSGTQVGLTLVKRSTRLTCHPELLPVG